MAKTVHSGGRIGAAASRLASPNTGKVAKSKAGKTLSNHKQTHHKK